jgi:hypothetical protein
MVMTRLKIGARHPSPFLWAAVPVFFCAALLVSSPLRADSWQADLAVSYQTGEYGSGETTTLVSVPLTLKYLFAQGEVSAMVPFVSMTTQGAVVVVDGAPQAVDGGGGGSVSGLGDIVLKGKYAALTQQGRLPYVDLVCRLKLPTAHEDLGTGEADVGFGTEVSYRFAKKYFAMADVMYTLIGDPPDVNYHNRFAWDLGAGWQPRPAWTLSLSYDSASSLVSRPAAASLMFYVGHRLRRDVRLYALVEFGLSATASDFGLTAGVKYSF